MVIGYSDKFYIELTSIAGVSKKAREGNETAAECEK